MSGYEQRARAIADAIIAELRGRRGLRHEWENIDDDVREEIAEAWAAIALRHAEQVAAEARGQAIEEAADLRAFRCMCTSASYTMPCFQCGARRAIRALAPRPGVRLVAREDLAHALGTCGCKEVPIPSSQRYAGQTWTGFHLGMPAAHTEAIDRLRAGEEG